MIEDLVKPELMSFIPYRENRTPCRIKLDANESPFGLPETVRMKLADYFSSKACLNLYPDSDSTVLRERLSDYWNVDSEGIVIGLGSNQIIDMVMDVFVGSGDIVLCPFPSFGMYKQTAVVSGGKVLEYGLEESRNFSYEPEEIIKLARANNPKLVFLCTPNNPTGNTINNSDIVKIIEGCSNSIVVADEAYAEFYGDSFIPMVSSYENVIVMRTFSKAFGLAGIRCGYSISGPKLAFQLNRVKPPYNIGAPIQQIAAMMLEETELIHSQVKYLIEQREVLLSRLKEIEGVAVYPSKSNFIFFKVPDACKVFEKLISRGILVRNFKGIKPLENFLRVSIGTAGQNSEFLAEFKDVMSNNLL